MKWSPWAIGGAIVGNVIRAVVPAPVVLRAADSTSAGIATGSFGASMMSASAIPNGDGVAAGGIVATLQSVGAGGLDEQELWHY